MANGASAARHRRDVEYSEYGTGMSIALSSLQEEAIKEAFTKGGSADCKRTWGSKHPTTMAVDLTGDHVPDTTLKFDYTWYGTCSKISVDGHFAADPDKDFGRIRSLRIPATSTYPHRDAKITVDRDIFGISKLTIDTESDGKPNLILKPDTDWLGVAQGMHVDWNADGKNDGYMKFKRNWCGNIDRVELRLSK